MKSTNLDLDLLDELIAKCEAKMASPFRKKKEPKEGLGALAEMSEDESEEEPAAAALIVEKKAEMPSDDEEVDMEALMELYKKIKA